MLCAGMCVAEICVQKVCVQYALSSTAIARVCERWMREGVGEGKIKKKKKRGTGKRKKEKREGPKGGDQEEVLCHQQRVSHLSIGQRYGFRFLQSSIKYLFYGLSLALSLITCNSPS